MKKSIKSALCAVLSGVMLSCSACALLPQEEVLPDAPIMRQDTSEGFSMTYVQRGDLTHEQRFSVNYRAVRQEKLSFEEDGLRIVEVYVSQGDSVRAGQLLMELEQGDLAQQGKSAQDNCDQLELELEQAIRDRELAEDAYALQLKYMTEKELEDADTMEEHLRSYDRSIEKLENQLSVARKTSSQVTESVRRRQLRAGIDGVVTYVRGVSTDDISSRLDTMITLSDTDSSMFVVETKYTDMFTVGQELTVYINQTPYPSRVISAQEAGAAGVDEVYLRSDIPAAELSDGDSGYLMLETVRYDDVLYVNTAAIKSMNGQHFVYIEDENGFRSIHEVEVGPAVDGNTVILSGLEEGDQIILQ